MRMCAYSRSSGQWWAESKDQVTMEDPDVVIANTPYDVSAWRLSFNAETGEVIVKYPGMTDIEASEQLQLDIQAEAEALAAAATPDPVPNDPA